MEKNIKTRITRINPEQTDIPLPSYATIGSSGMDIHAALENDVVIKPGERKLIPSGFCIEIPPGFEAQVRPRSGLVINHGITVLNTPGTIDSDYRGEVKVILINLGSKDFVVRRGDRIAQLIFVPVVHVEWEEVNDLNNTSRGKGGFGHTGR